MTDAPIAQIIHTGGHIPAGWKQQALTQWLTLHGINPNLVAAAEPITVLPVPYQPEGQVSDGPWMVQVIVFNQFYMREDGTNDHNLITRKSVTFQRTVPLRVPFPAGPTTDDEGVADGEAVSEAAEEAPQDLVRSSRQAPVSDRHEGPGQERTRTGSTERIEGNAEDHSSQGDQAVPEPEENQRRTQEVAEKRDAR